MRGILCFTGQSPELERFAVSVVFVFLLYEFDIICVFLMFHREVITPSSLETLLLYIPH